MNAAELTPVQAFGLVVAAVVLVVLGLLGEWDDRRLRARMDREQREREARWIDAALRGDD